MTMHITLSFKRISFYIMEDQLIVNNVLKFEKIYALENDYNCLIIDQENNITIINGKF